MLVALDVDGTLLHYDGTMSDPVRESVRAVAAAGHHVVVATGRSVIAATPITEHLQLTTGFVVCSNGAVTISLDPAAAAGYHLVETVTFDPGPVLTKLRDAWPDAAVAVEVLGEGFLLSAPFPAGELNGVQKVVSWEELSQRPTTRLTFRSESGTAEDFMELAERLGLHEVNYAVGFSAWLDVNPEGVSKASALEQVRRRLGVEPGDTLAIGDHRNDVEMLAWAARGVAMGQAPPEVKAVADEITGTIDEDGAATILRSLL